MNVCIIWSVSISGKALLFYLHTEMHWNILLSLTDHCWWPENVKRFIRERNHFAREWNILDRGYGGFQALCGPKETTLQWSWLDIEYLTRYWHQELSVSCCSLTPTVHTYWSITAGRFFSELVIFCNVLCHIVRDTAKSFGNWYCSAH